MAYQLNPLWEQILDAYSKQAPDPRKAKCYECKFRANIPGDAHSECHAPAGKVEFMYLIMQPTLQFGPVTMPLVWNDQSFNQYFLWPVNFDPRWLMYCFLFKDKEANGEQTNGVDSSPAGVDRT